jgi:hypothetical protein
MAGFSRFMPASARIETDWIDPDGRQAKNVFYGHGSDFSSITQLETLGSAVPLLYTTAVSGFALYQLFAPFWQLQGLVISDNSGDSENSIDVAINETTPAGDVGLSPNCCTLVSWNIAASYRGGHPRTYFPPASADTLSGSGRATWSAAYVTNVVAKLGAGFTAMNAALPSGVKIGTVAASRHGVQLSPPIFYPYLGFTVKPRVCSQRRRLGKSGG